MAKNKGKEFVGARSICLCGHPGDGGGDHADEAVYARGTGRCLKCDCNRFTWKGWTRKYQNFLTLMK